MKVAWLILLVSAFTDFMIAAGGIYVATVSDGKPISSTALSIAIVTGSMAAARTIQNALKATPETSAALKGDMSVVSTQTVVKTP